MSFPIYWQRSKKFLGDIDPKLSILFKKYKNLTISSRGNALETLLRSIVGQQISVQAAASRRFQPQPAHAAGGPPHEPAAGQGQAGR